jgi:ATP-dependent RNA helicase DDX56/DBP9
LLCTKRNGSGAQEFNKGIFDYLIATDDPAKRAGREPDEEADAGNRGASKKGPEKDHRKRRRAEHDAEFGVIRGIDFKGVRTVINVDMPDTVQVKPAVSALQKKQDQCL